VIGLAGHIFFGDKPADEESPDSPLLPWLSGVVREVLRLPADEPVRDRSLADLGMESIQAVALQYQLTDRLNADVPLERLLSGQGVAGLAASLARELPEDVVREYTEVSR
jgi:methionyl-tRNA synthetase